jgi:hypothetical protein
MVHAVESLAKFQKVSLYLSTLASLTLIILFSEMLKISKIISSKSKNILKENSEYLRIFHIFNECFKINQIFGGHVLKWPRYYPIYIKADSTPGSSPVGSRQYRKMIKLFYLQFFSYANLSKSSYG